jgi:AGZA family xanthine/uracil permease-like MFS transporter
MVQRTQDKSETKASAEISGLASVVDRTFGLTAAGSSVPTELRAGLATFLTMAYIMFVSPWPTSCS